MSMVTLLFVFCIISCAPAFYGLEVDQVTSARDSVKGTATLPEARAKEIGTVLVTQLEAKTKEIGIAFSGHDSTATRKYGKSTRKAMYVSLSRRSTEDEDEDEDEYECNSWDCLDREPNPDAFCLAMKGCYLCDREENECTYAEKTPRFPGK